jgi:hypothetical protein
MSAVIDTAPIRGRAPARTVNEGGGTMDDVLKRLGALETMASETRSDVNAIKAVLPYLATKEDIGLVKAEINSVRAEIGSVSAESHSIRAEISAAETRLTRWMVGTLFLAASAAFGFAKLVN